MSGDSFEDALNELARRRGGSVNMNDPEVEALLAEHKRLNPLSLPVQAFWWIAFAAMLWVLFWANFTG